MSFEALRERLPVLTASDDPSSPWPLVGRGGVSFSDDLTTLEGGRLGVRVRVTDRDGGGYLIDLRDSDPRLDHGNHRFALSQARTLTACLIALGHALDRTPTMAWSSHVELLTDPATWIGADEHETDPAAIAFGVARTADALLGALANAWPGRVGAGSCSLGAIVELTDADGIVLTEVLPGGEGGRPDRSGSDAWAGIVLPSPWPSTPSVPGLALEGQLREGSGGTGKHGGGQGIVRRYRSERPIVARVAFDRTSNPPHGIDRAGPPSGTEAWVYLPDHDRPIAVKPWSRHELPAGARLEILTCGGAGWGFPGYGDIEWDPSEWFGSKPKPSA